MRGTISTLLCVSVLTRIGCGGGGGVRKEFKPQAQEVLDELRDTERLIRRTRAVQSAISPPDVKAWQDMDGLVAALENRCRRLHARYMRERPALLTLTAQAVAHPHAVATRRPPLRRPARRQIAS